MKLFLFFVFIFYSTSTYSSIEITHFNIGQGDSTLILSKSSTGHNKAILIDAGYIKSPDSGEVISAYLKDRGITEIDAVIITHYEAAHYGGLVTKPKDKPRNYWGSRIQDGVD